MIIKTLEVENWKCFEKKKSWDFNRHELISLKNGSGKSSLFQAIEFAMYGKPPVGFNLNSVRYDDTKPCRVFISFDVIVDGVLKEASIKRIFGGRNLSELKLDGELICESIRSIDNWIDKTINCKISRELWTSSLINSDILNSNFITKVLLDDILKDPTNLASIYKSKIFYMNKIINGFNEDIIDIKKIEKELEEIKKDLIKPQNDSSKLYNLAIASENAHLSIQKIEKFLEEYEKNIPQDEKLSLEDARLYNLKIRFKNRFEKELETEKAKKVSIYSIFNEKELKKIIDASEKTGICIACGGNFNENHKKHLEDIINNMSNLSSTERSEDKIKELEGILKLLNKDQKYVNNILELENQKVILNKCPNYKEVIDNYNEESIKKWNEFERLQKEYSLALKQQEKLKEINELKEKVTDYKEKMNVINNYISDASVYYTEKILEKASQYISNINDRYKQIFLYEGSFHVLTENADTFALNLLPVSRLSSGEKTICSLSLLFAIHNLLVPDLPLLFDETFSSLDKENLDRTQNFLRKQFDTQIFIITHNTEWKEF